MEPSRTVLQQVKLGTGMKRILEAFRIALPITLAGNDLLRCDYAAYNRRCAARFHRY